MKSVEIKFNEACASLKKANLMHKFNAQFTNIKESSIEVKLNAALDILKGACIIESITESGWGLSFVPKPHILKKNGAAASFTEADPTTQRKEKQVEMVMKSCNMTEAGARMFLGLKDKTPEGLTERQTSEYTFARRCGISEADALTLAKMPLRSRG
jgi:hypothetical protein